MMTRKDYKLIAQAIQKATSPDEPEIMSKSNLLDCLNREFILDNPRFNPSKFIAAACSIDDVRDL